MTDTLTPSGHAAQAAQARLSTAAPISSMRPISSTIGMNSVGDMLPSTALCQRASASKPTILPRRDGDDGLEVDIDAVARDRRAQFELDQAADLDLGVHRLFERPPYPPAVRLRRVKRDIGLREQGVGTDPVVGRRSAADAGADDHLAAVDDHRAVDFLDDALGDGGRLRLAGRVTVKDDKFVAAPARHQIARADDRR